MKKYGVCILLFLFIICVFFEISINFTKKNLKKHLSKKEKINELINIDDLSDEFMDDFFSDYALMESQNNLENVLIIISDKGIKNSYGATNIVNAPNHQYFLQYKNKKEKDAAFERLKDDDYLSVEENEIIKITDNNSSSQEYMSWGVNAMGLDYAKDEADKNIDNLEEITVAVIDTGLNVDLFNNNFSQSKLAGTYNVLDKTTNVTDINSHGTHVSGIVAEGTPSNVKIFNIKAGVNSFYFTSEIAAINYVVNNDIADVINMSLGGYTKDNAVYQAINAAKNKNIIVVCSSGNDYSAEKIYPASYDNTISVGSVEKDFTKSSFSNYGGTINFVAPGSSILSINGTKTGTSMAAPHLSAAVAIVKSYNKDLTLNQTIDVLKKTSDDLGNYGWDQYYGNGFVNFRNNNFCDGSSCDLYNVFKSDEINIDNVVKIEFDEIYSPSYNYGNITNLMNSRINVYYTETNYITKYIGEIDDIEIEGYNPNSNTVQNVTVKYKDKQAILIVDNKNSSISGWKYEIDNNKATITEFLYDEEGPIRVYIPDKLDEYDVVGLGNNLFEDNTFIRNIFLPESVVDIGNSVFKNSNIKDISISASEISVGDYAFYGLKYLKTINSEINQLGMYSFAECPSLKSIVLKDNLKIIGEYAFYNDYKLETINVPSSLTYIGEYAFSKTGISSFDISSSIERINDGVFSDCFSLKNVKISDGVKTIGEYAFANTIINSLSIPKSVSSIKSTSFLGIAILESINVDSANDYYKSENNMLIEKASDKVVLGSYQIVSDKNVAIIPSYIKIIGEYAFYNKVTLQEIVIPDGLIEIQNNAFSYSLKISKMNIPKSVTTIGTDSYFNTVYNLTNWIYYDSYARNFLKNNDRTYKTIDPYEVTDNLSKRNYKAFETVDVEGLRLTLKYEDKVRYKDPNIRTETISDNYEIKYQNGDSLTAGDTYFTIETTTATGYKLSHNVEVNVSKIKPNYEVPTNIKGTYGQILSSVILPSGFEWMNPNEIINNSETQTFKARYIPNDTNNYEIVEDIDITVSVGKQVINPEITISDKTYDGTNNIDINLISISNIDSKDYTVTNATITNPNVGSKDAKVTIKLSDEKYLNYSFENNTQEKEFTVSMNVTPEKLLKPTLENREYVYNGSEQEVSIINYDNNKMNISGNTRTKAGTQKITISLKNNNYIWEDGTSEDIKYDFIINKADINLVDNSKDVEITYDGNNHTIEYNVESSLNTSVKYMDINGEYTLSEIPKYKDIGSYVVKYKVSIDDNYNDYYNEKTITIIIGDIVNNTVDYEGYFDNKEHTLDIKTSVSDYDIKYLNNTDYNLSEIPKYKDIGEYTINYKITKSGYNDLFGSNKVRIYGIKKFDSSIKVKNEMLITSDFSFDELIGKADVYANTVNYEHYNNNSELVSDVGIKTKDKIKIILNNDSSFEYSIVLLGDTDGDGEISYLDYVNVYNHIQKIKHPESNKKLLEKEYLQAADMSLDDEIDYMDYVEIYNKIKELKGGE